MERQKNTTCPYPAAFLARTVQMVIDHLDGCDVAHRSKLGCSPDSLRVWYKQVQRDLGQEEPFSKVTSKWL